MKKYILISTVTISALIASPKAQQFAQEIWYLVNGTITADATPAGNDPLLVLNKGAERKVVVSNWGGLGLGKNAETVYGNLAGGDKVFAVSVVQDGDPTYGHLYSEVTEDLNLSVSSWFSAIQQRMSATRYRSEVTVGSFSENTDNEWHIISDSEQESANVIRFNNSLVLNGAGSIKAGGTEAWKLGSVVPATVQLVTDKYVQVEIGGQIVKLAVVE